MLALILLGMIGLASGPAGAVTANGPYYATPSWDQKLPTSTRFIVLSNWNNEAVLDRETGLVWERSPRTDSETAPMAQRICSYKSVDGRMGWRLPTIQELTSLADPTQVTYPSLPPGHPFMNVQFAPADYYWSTTLTYIATYVYAFSFGNVTSAVALDKTGNGELHVWCVRGGAVPAQ